MRLGQQRLLRQVGAGADGVAYEAETEQSGEPTEVHELGRARSDLQRWGWLVSRLRMAALLDHSAVMRVVELNLEHDPPYAVRQRWPQDTLAGKIRAGGRIDEEAVSFVRRLASAVQAAHALGIVHGHLVPSKVWLDRRECPALDFTAVDVHSWRGDDETQALDAGCTSPEVSAGSPPTRAADVYGLGAMLALLSARPGPDDRTEETAGFSEPAVDPSLPDLIKRMTSTDPEERPSASEVVRHLASSTMRPEATGEWTLSPRSTIPAATSRDDETSVFAPHVVSVVERPETLGRFRLLELLGQGGQGAVYRAEDTADRRIVAVKILKAEGAGRPEMLKRFQKEARLLAAANNPYVVNLLEFNEDKGIPYLVLEFVAGRNLGERIAESVRLDEPTALQIMASVARALSYPHERGIIHRDVKPANIMLLDSGTGSIPVKLSDFGLARHVVDSQSLALTAAGALLGTPHYMAPEQWNGLATDPRTDVYAMGATLFHMLAGRPPFTGQTRDELLSQHCTQPIPHLRPLHPGISEGTIRVVEKALAKRPEDRYADAGAMLHDLDALVRGAPTGLSLHPRLPACDPSDVIEFEWAWELESSPRTLWPHVSNTERVNRALGLPAPEFAARIGARGDVEQYGSFRKVVPFKWREHPFEWVEGQRFGVLREFQQGVFQWFISLVELQLTGQGGTRLVQHIRVLPRGLGGKLMAHLQLARSGRRALENVYRRIDAAASGRLGPPEQVDPFEDGVKLGTLRQARLEDVLNKLGQHQIDSSLIERLGFFVAQAPDPEVARIRPLALAERWRVDPDSLVSACLRGTQEGLLVLLWDLLCPVCRISSETQDTLRAIRDHGRCSACNLEYPLDFASSVELVFRVHPEIRQVDLGTYCIGGPAHSPHVLAQVRVGPGERIDLNLELPEGGYRLRGPQLPWSVDFQVQAQVPTRLWEIDLAKGPLPHDPRALRVGHQVLTLGNPLDREVLVRVERTAERRDALTAARAAALALFRELFPGEVLSPGQLATVSIVTLLVIDLDPDQADDLYQQLGDAQAYNVVQELHRLLELAIREAGGAVVKTLGEGLMAAFSDPARAVRLALQAKHLMVQSDLTRSLRLRMGLHRGRAMAANVNDRLDYFGTSARQVLKLVSHVRGNELALTLATAADPLVARVLQTHGIEPNVISVDDPGLPHFTKIAFS